MCLVARADPPARLAVVFGPLVMDPAAWDEVKQRAEPFVGREAPGVLALRDVVRLEGRIGFGYDVPEGASVAALTRTRPVIPAPTAAQLLARVVQTLVDLGPRAFLHPGPTSDDVLVDLSGRVKVAGFIGERGDVEASEGGLVRRLGHLLATWLSGRTWVAATTPASHEALLRRLLLDVAARPGATFEPAYRKLLRRMVAWNAAERPSLGEVLDVLRSVAAGPVGEPLERWARHGWRMLDRPPEPVRYTLDPTEPTEDVQGPGAMAVDRPTQPTEDDDLFGVDRGDDDTALSQPGQAPGAVVEQGAIPVGVGPPAEAVRPVRLPPELFESGSVTRPTRGSWLLGVSAAVFVLSGLVLALAFALAG